MASSIINLRSGWLVVAASDTSARLDVLKLTHSHGNASFVHDIHVPVDVRWRQGELIAAVHRSGERFSIGEGILIPYDRGVKLVAADDFKKSKLRLQVIQSLEHEFVQLSFYLDGFR